MTVTRYDFRLAVAAFFEIATEDARRILPPRLTPLEVHYGRSILMINAYDFADSPVGAYGELVYGIMTVPRLIDGVVPQGAVFPWQVATTTPAARAHAIERWHLPHWPEDIELDVRQDGDALSASARAGGTPVLSLHIAARRWQDESRLYQSFMRDDAGALHMATIQYDGELSEHEEGTGTLSLALGHPFNAALRDADVDEVPFRETCQRGRQTFQPLEPLA